jgi:hypothetical protein
MDSTHILDALESHAVSVAICSYGPDTLLTEPLSGFQPHLLLSL